MRTNYHTHCEFCDGKASAATMAETAAAKGYSVLGFSSHAPIPFETTWAIREERLPEYAAEIRRLKKAWAPGGECAIQAGRSLEILLGLEIDWYEGLRSPRDALFDPIGLDYKLGSVHYIAPKGCLPFTVDSSAENFGRDAQAAIGGEGHLLYEDYYARLTRMIAEGGFDIVGHFDLVSRNNTDGRWFDEDSPGYLSAAFAAAEALEGSPIVVEINLGGLARGKMKRPHPSLPIVKRLKELGVRVTFCADAHCPEHLGVHIDAARALAKAAGYESAAIFSGGVWSETGLDEV